MENLKEVVTEILAGIAKMPIADVLDDLNMLLPEEVAEKLKIGKSTVYNLVNRGELPATKIGGSVRVRPRALYAYVLINERNPQSAAVAA